MLLRKIQVGIIAIWAMALRHDQIIDKSIDLFKKLYVHAPEHNGN